MNGWINNLIENAVWFLCGSSAVPLLQLNLFESKTLLLAGISEHKCLKKRAGISVSILMCPLVIFCHKGT
jgi:hypothetical protein